MSELELVQYHQGLQLAGYELLFINIEYFSTTLMIWKQNHPAANPQKLMKEIKEYLKKTKPIYISDGSERLFYNCNLGQLDLLFEFQSNVYIYNTGTCTRM